MIDSAADLILGLALFFGSVGIVSAVAARCERRDKMRCAALSLIAAGSALMGVLMMGVFSRWQ